MAAATNRIERRSDLLADALTDRVNSTYKALTEPQPAWQARKSEWEQVRDYASQLQSGQLGLMRRSQGGPYDDAEVDRYVGHMERLVPKYTDKLQQMQEA